MSTWLTLRPCERKQPSGDRKRGACRRRDLLARFQSHGQAGGLAPPPLATVCTGMQGLAWLTPAEKNSGIGVGQESLKRVEMGEQSSKLVDS